MLAGSRHRPGVEGDELVVAHHAGEEASVGAQVLEGGVGVVLEVGGDLEELEELEVECAQQGI